MPESAKLQNQCRNVELPSFGSVGDERILAEDDLFAVICDKYPVSPGHCLVVAKCPVARFHELSADERYRLITWIDWTIEHLKQSLRQKPDGFNFGLNDGAAAGQTMEQLHAHVIPRYLGDVPDPRGGIRYVVPQKAKYWCRARDDEAEWGICREAVSSAPALAIFCNPNCRFLQ